MFWRNSIVRTVVATMICFGVVMIEPVTHFQFPYGVYWPMAMGITAFLICAWLGVRLWESYKHPLRERISEGNATITFDLAKRNGKTYLVLAVNGMVVPADEWIPVEGEVTITDMRSYHDRYTIRVHLKKHGKLMSVRTVEIKKRPAAHAKIIKTHRGIFRGGDFFDRSMRLRG